MLEIRDINVKMTNKKLYKQKFYENKKRLGLCTNCSNVKAVINKTLCQKCLDRHIIYNKKYYKINRDDILNQQKEYAKINKNKIKIYKKKYYEDNINELSRKCKNYYNLNKDDIKNKQRKYNKTDVGKIVSKEHTRKRRAIKNNIIELFLTSEWNKKLKQLNYKCVVCNKQKKLTLDHIYPLSKANEDYLKTGIKRVYTINDVQPLCFSCNSSKSNKIVGEL
jgi:hypothetical protein